MKVFAFRCLSCSICRPEVPLFQKLSVVDEGFYTSKCDSCGSESRAITRVRKFELLFDIGAVALLDGYPRETVTTMAAALERLMGFYINVIVRRHRISSEQVVKMWKSVAAQSERQLGAFVYLRLVHRGTASPFPMETKMLTRQCTAATFRNDVVHKGYIPAEAEAEEFADIIHASMYELLQELTSDAWDQTVAVVEEEFADARKRHAQAAEWAFPTIVSLQRAYNATHQDVVDAVVAKVQDPAAARAAALPAPTFREALARHTADRQELETMSRVGRAPRAPS